ncbi:hypothetical protein FF38_07989 [Lucilia cuprina]|uniref:Uncharacterized protein n=1 Tax=Lucilia cuprina TaxID=7375 RepID=A0A0L0C5X0_LUCCU|nr:hypothetical protein FF38_07989 [Lucilia cuprina]
MSDVVFYKKTVSLSLASNGREQVQKSSSTGRLTSLLSSRIGILVSAYFGNISELSNIQLERLLPFISLPIWQEMLMPKVPQSHCLRYFKHDVLMRRRCRHIRVPIMPRLGDLNN